ncbi:hypothetical protein NBRC111893_582 [Lentilactobacillus kosonis]|uniref:CopG family transcriptional regulator n=1 Tax=Lentilactobacillus kosonis TaxID=2810561 RepID=A0A401FJG8_9LACO|nr:hypothetical protein NBRC111893_582 [Lentilactobacillus kosonis]
MRAYAALKGISLSELFRSAALEKAEDELDRKTYDEAMAEFKQDPTTYSPEEVKRMLMR